MHVHSSRTFSPRSSSRGSSFSRLCRWYFDRALPCSLPAKPRLIWNICIWSSIAFVHSTFDRCCTRMARWYFSRRMTSRCDLDSVWRLCGLSPSSVAFRLPGFDGVEDVEGRKGGPSDGFASRELEGVGGEWVRWSGYGVSVTGVWGAGGSGRWLGEPRGSTSPRGFWGRSSEWPPWVSSWDTESTCSLFDSEWVWSKHLVYILEEYLLRSSSLCSISK